MKLSVPSQGWGPGGKGKPGPPPPSQACVQLQDPESPPRVFTPPPWLSPDAETTSLRLFPRFPTRPPRKQQTGCFWLSAHNHKGSV